MNTLALSMNSEAELLASLPEAERLKHLATLNDKDAAQLLTCWRFWARPNQIAPDGDWRTWLILAGRGFGKTRSGSEWIREMACGASPLSGGRYERIALVAETSADARDVMVEGESGILAVHPKSFRPNYEPSKRRLTWPNGAVATLYNATEPDQLRGPQHDLAWCDELAKWRYVRETWDMLQFGMRLGDDPRQCITTTPRPIPIVKELLAAKGTVVTRGGTRENQSNLPTAFFEQIVAKYEGTRLGRQELDAEIIDDVPGALWPRSVIDRQRLMNANMPDMQRVVVSVDPSGADDDNPENDAIGIVIAGVGVDGKGYVLEDLTIQASPAKWGAVVASAFDRHRADLVVAEGNFGGGMVHHVIETARANTPFKLVHASRGKVVRAEPVAALYETGKVFHVGLFPQLEDEMCSFSTTGYIGEGSPNRADALVWALTELFPGMTNRPIKLNIAPPKVSAGWG